MGAFPTALNRTTTIEGPQLVSDPYTVGRGFWTHLCTDPSSCTSQEHPGPPACCLQSRETSMPWGEHECECPDCPPSVPCPGRCGIRGRCGLVALVRETPTLGSLAVATHCAWIAASMVHICNGSVQGNRESSESGLCRSQVCLCAAVIAVSNIRISAHA